MHIVRLYDVYLQWFKNLVIALTWSESALEEVDMPLAMSSGLFVLFH